MPCRLVILLVLAPSIWLPYSGTRPACADEGLAQRVRAIFSNNCFACHGPDPEERQGGFRLDDRESMLAEADSGERPVVPGEPDASELLRRLTADDGERMPPEDFGRRLTAADIDLVRAWIAQGAELPRHWSFIPPVRPDLPRFDSDALAPVEPERASRWLSHPIDRFVLDRQLEHGLAPSPEAPRGELLRRVSLDLTGLPPTPEQVAEFERDRAPGAYERQVDRLLASPAYGEHWARKWLDLAR